MLFFVLKSGTTAVVDDVVVVNVVAGVRGGGGVGVVEELSPLSFFCSLRVPINYCLPVITDLHVNATQAISLPLNQSW